MLDVYDIVGTTGASCSIYCYARVQWRRDFAKEFSYSLLNLMAACLIGVSLSKHWNFSSVLINSFWGVISIYGLYRCIKYHRRGKAKKT